METIEILTRPRAFPSPEIVCGELPAFDESNLASVQRAFQAVKPCEMRQTWQSEVSPGFAPASVRVGHRDDCLLVLAELTDQDVFTHASSANQRLWELGDVFEIYLRPADQTAYFQMDIAPNNQRTQLQIPGVEALRRAQTANEFADLVQPGPGVHSAIWLMPAHEKWFVYAAIPARLVCGRATLNAEKQWRFSFARYDYTRGQLEPVISSTSSHTQANFHRQHEWGGMGEGHGRSIAVKTERLAAK